MNIHHFNRSLHNAVIEAGAWLITTGFFSGLLWLAENLL